MSKMDALRALREARYDQERKAGTTKSTTSPKAAAPKAPRRTDAPAPDAATGVPEALCGHRSMNGRTCTREHGHSAKSHRYS